MVRHIDVIADNGGNVTLQVGKTWRHQYPDGATAGRDILSLLNGDHPLRDRWEGNEAKSYPYAHMERYDYEVERNGGYRWYHGTPRQVVTQLCNIDPETAWGNVRALAAALTTAPKS